ncbi:MAG: hypothetical protein HY341_01115 [Candidatus Kerfeldbacteria bacterium]|nr:hypothetical protein [Candidatus Kerfeldbacteria bacterium]
MDHRDPADQQTAWRRGASEPLPRRRWHTRPSAAEKDLSNPFFRKPPVRRSFSGRGKWYIGVILLGSFILVGFTPYFRIRDIEIIGVQYANADAIRKSTEKRLDQRRWLILPNRNPLFLNHAHLADDLVNALRESVSVESLRITTRLPDTLVVTIRERIPRLTWVSQDTTFSVDRQGVVSEQIEEGSVNPEFPRVFDLGNAPTRVGDTVIDPALVDYVFTVRGRLPGIIGGPIDYFSVPKGSTTELHARTQEGWEIYLDRSVPLDVQLENLQLLLERKFTDAQRRQLRYVDVRYTDRVYYK